MLLHGAEKNFPPKDTKSSPASGNANTKHVSTNAAVGDIHSQESTKGLLPVASLAVSSDATITNSLALCDSASTHSWVSAYLVKCLHLVGTPVNLTINGFNSTSLMKTHQVSFQVSAETNNSDFLFSFRAYVKDHISIGSDSISIPELQEKYPQLAPIKPIHYKYEEVEIIIGQNFYHAIRLVEYLLGEDSTSPCAVRLPIGWVLSGPFPPSFKSNSSCFKCVVEDMSLADQIKTWCELESYVAFKQVDARSDADERALSVLKNDTFHDGERYIVPMLWNDKESTLPNNYFSSLAQLNSLEKRLDKDPSLREKYAETIREDIQKGYVITVKAHNLKSRADREWYLPHHPVLNPNKPGKVCRVLNGASKCHGASLNKSLLIGPDLLQNLFLRFRQHKYAVSADIEGMF